MAVVRNIFVLYEEGLEALAPHIEETVDEIMSCFPEHQDDYPIKILGNWKNKEYKRVNEKGQEFLLPFESLDWYIARAKHRSKNEERFQKTGQISVNQLCEDLAADPYTKKIPQWSILITRHDLYATGLNYCLGISEENKFAIVSVARFIDEDNKLDLENFKTVLMHEFGHLIGLTNKKRVNTEELLGAHCTNDGCIMQQRMNGDFTDLTKARLKKKHLGKPPICDDCIREGRKFFVRQKLAYNLIQEGELSR